MKVYQYYSYRMGKQIQNYSLQVELGQGVYSRVFKAINMITKQQVAIKMVKADKFKEMPKLEEGTINQINTLTNLRPCPNIIRYFDMLKTVNNFYFVYEYCNGGTLEKILKKSSSLGQTQSLLYFKQLTNAFKVLAENNIMHRDIKPENILIHNGILKIADFGFCKPLQHQDGMAETMLGSPIYMAPEVLKGQHYTMKADVWSLGVVLYRMIFGFCPFESNNIGKLILMLNQNQLKIPENPKISPLLEQLIRKMLTKDPKKRADWNEVFTYQITENGEILDPKLRNGKGFDTYSLKASTAVSSQGSKGPVLLKQQNQDNIRRIKRVQSPKHNESCSGFKGEKNFHKNNLSLIPDTSLRDTYKSKSPLRGTLTTNANNLYSKKQVHTKNHRKCIQLTSMAIEVANYQCSQSTPVAFFLCKVIEKEFLMLKESLRKDGLAAYTSSMVKDPEDSFFSDLQNIINQELKHLNQLLYMLEGILNQSGVRTIQILENRKRYLKKFIEAINNNQSNKQQLSLCHQLLDFVLENILINKKTYEKLKEEQIQRKINEKLQQIN